MDMRHVHAACTRSMYMDKKHGLAVRTLSMEMNQGHADRTSGIDIDIQDEHMYSMKMHSGHEE